jgi:hypothetical protein
MPASLTSLTGAMLATGSFGVRGAGSSPNPELFIAAHFAPEETSKVRNFGIVFEIFGIEFELFRTVFQNSKFRLSRFWQ